MAKTFCVLTTLKVIKQIELYFVSLQPISSYTFHEQKKYR